MKKIKLNYTFNVLASVLTVLVTLSSCTNDSVQNNEEEAAVTYEKQLVITDASGRNSITLLVSSKEDKLLTPHTLEAYELLVHSEVPQKTFNLNYSRSESIAIQDNYENLQPAVRLTVVDTDFKDEVGSYSLVSNIEEEDMSKGINLCRWFPRTFSYYQVDNVNANGITTTFGRTKNTCNNIEYLICEFNSTSPFRAYQLKHPGDQETTNSVGQGMTILYRYKKNTVITYTWF
ncbi:MAG: hypothetical protein AB8B65_01205 [Kordia sp.]|uniref:hypothetical protein n=1 Tax=Kordia sp. TaxID=1965332 RepID=UPI00385901C9